MVMKLKLATWKVEKVSLFLPSLIIMTDNKILCVGLVCLDIVNYCAYYPAEDEDIRATNQKWHKGGNAANTASVLRMLGREVEFFGTLGTGVETE